MTTSRGTRPRAALRAVERVGVGVAQFDGRVVGILLDCAAQGVDADKVLSARGPIGGISGGVHNSISVTRVIPRPVVLGLLAGILCEGAHSPDEFTLLVEQKQYAFALRV